MRLNEVDLIGGVDVGDESPKSNVWPVRPSLRPEPSQAAFALHDAKNMMGVIAANLEVLESALAETKLPAIAKEALADIDESARRMSGLLREALCGLQGQRQQSVAPSKLHVPSIVASVVERMGPAARARGVRVVQSGADDTWATIAPDRLERVIVNLLENAVRFSPRGGTVQVEYISRNGRTTLAVGDRGPGVPEEARDDVFRSYRRRDSLGTDSHFGLGLAYCRKVAREHGGDAWVFNRAEGGACFVFEIA
jgi:two-component system clock-associated histidine kinase SasA